MNAQQCLTCKYFAVPLSDNQKSIANCPGANPFGDPKEKICTLKEKPEFQNDSFTPENCEYYFPIYMRFR